MAKFVSFDGVDKNGIRAEVTVMTGTGTISEIVGRGKQNEDGTYRNVEVVFTPDNPLLKRKVYGLLDTTSTELWEYVKQAHDSGKNITYRIESQRRNGVDRTKAITDLVPTEDVRRILAAIDGHFSHEAKTNPAEDPDNENPSALTQAISGTATVPTAGAVDADALAATIAATLHTPTALYTPDGLVNYGSDAVKHAAQAEQFALTHLVDIYTPARSKTPIDITDDLLAQAAALALTLMRLADDVHRTVLSTGGTSLTGASRDLALNLVCDAVATRHPAPIGGDSDAQQQWHETVLNEAADRMYVIGLIAQGQAASPRPAALSTNVDTNADDDITPDVDTSDSDFAASFDDFIPPSDDLINRVRALCAEADLLDHPTEISDWMEAAVGQRSARKVSAPRLEALIAHYEAAGPAALRETVLPRVNA